MALIQGHIVINLNNLSIKLNQEVQITLLSIIEELLFYQNIKIHLDIQYIILLLLKNSNH